MACTRRWEREIFWGLFMPRLFVYEIMGRGLCCAVFFVALHHYKSFDGMESVSFLISHA